MLLERLLELLMIPFVEYFPISSTVSVLIALMLFVLRKKFKSALPTWVCIFWYSYVVAGFSMLILLVVDFFMLPKGIGRLASIPLFLGLTPLFACSIILSFFLPRQVARS